MRFVRWHHVLQVAAGFVEEVFEDGPRYYISYSESPAFDRLFDGLHLTVFIKFLS